jgi:hypothetical protein
MITENQAQRLAEAGLYAYNNLDTSEEYYKWYPPVDLKTVYKQWKCSQNECYGL